MRAAWLCVVCGLVVALAALPFPLPAPTGDRAGTEATGERPAGVISTEPVKTVKTRLKPEAAKASRPAAPAEVSRSELPAVRTLVVEATAYYEKDGNGDGVTATGTLPRPGICAVDPKVIPFGSVVQVPGYGPARAEDTGGLICGNRIDVFFLTKEECLKWGRRTVTVEVYR